MDTKLRTDAKNDFEKDFFKINDIKLITKQDKHKIN